MTQDEEGGRKLSDQAFLIKIAEANKAFGFINIYCGESSTLSSCCRLRSRISDLGYSNTFGSGSTKIGAWVCHPQLAPRGQTGQHGPPRFPRSGL